MEVRPGYKQTEVGVIPEDWEVKPLYVLADKIMVGIASAATHAYRDRGVVMFRNQNIKPGRLDDSEVLYIAEVYEETFRNKRLKQGDLLTARTGYPGTTCIVPLQYEGAQSFTTLITRPCRNAVDSAYLCCFINSETGQLYFEQNQIGGGQKNVNAGSLKHLLVSLPPTKAEQEAIAQALVDADVHIKSLEQLVAKKRLLKQGAMQELLTGKKRLPGFREEWKMERLGELGSFLKGSGVTKNESRSGNLACVRYGEIYTRHDDYIRTFHSWISSHVAEKATRLKRGDILFAGSGETKDEIGKCAAFVDDIEAYAGGDVVILRVEKGDPLFLGYYLNTEPINRQKASKGQGDTVVHISSYALADLCVTVPLVSEQTAIASILLDIDAEITSLEAKLAKARQIKQGMMQELLTGRIRLV
jgi:type I restriction enzyme, S subunit